MGVSVWLKLAAVTLFAGSDPSVFAFFRNLLCNHWLIQGRGQFPPPLAYPKSKAGRAKFVFRRPPHSLCPGPPWPYDGVSIVTSNVLYS